MTSETIPEEVWNQATKALTRFFGSKGCGDRVSDLVQDTLTRISGRTEYRFEEEEDFLRLCHGFARMILLEDRRKWNRNRSAVEYDDSALYGGSRPKSLSGVERQLHNRKLLELLKPCLKEEDWRMLEDSLEMDRETQARKLGVSNANAMGVRIFRALEKVRKRLRNLGDTSL